MDELLEQFLIEGRDLVSQGQEELASLMRDPADARAIDGAFRAIHTLKGSVAIFAMAPAERLLHAAESLLERARKQPASLLATDVNGLVISLDQVDRWIDAMERDGELGEDAEAIAAGLLAYGEAEAEGALSIGTEAPIPPWAAELAEREHDLLARSTEPLVAFRYTPDADAFFRGDDPVALVATLPGLAALAISPATGAWPSLSEVDPFACIIAIEGLAAAPIEDVRAIFRLAPDQILFHVFAPAAASSTPGVAANTPSVLRVDAARVDRLADRVGELAIASNAFSGIAERAERVDPALALSLRAAQAELDRTIGAVHRSVSAVRLVPLAPALTRLPRLVREICAGLSKSVNFTIIGDGIEVDKQIADGLFEPLLHLIRNALDHGIEQPKARIAAGKEANGHLSLTIARDGDDVLITLADDGTGIDRGRIVRKAIERGLVVENAAAELSDTGILALIFAAGFSTASEVSDVSGRGVGMDAVQAAVDRMRGRIEVESVLGQGTTFRLRLPANALTTSLLVIDVGSDRYAVPFAQIAETTRISSSAIMAIGSGAACVLRDRTVPVLSLAELLGGIETGVEPARLLVAQAGSEQVAFRVDGFSDRIDAMVRAPGGLLANVPSIAGTTVLSDGEVLVVLDLPELVA